VLLVGEPVDDGDRGVLGKLVDVGLRERAHDDPVQVAREDVCGVLDRLAAPELELVGGEEERKAAELGNSDAEGDTRPRRGFREDQADRAAGEEVVLLTALLENLQLVGEVEHLLELGPRPVGNAREMAAFQALRDREHVPTLQLGKP
jgi:hypothetical protein